MSSRCRGSTASRFSTMAANNAWPASANSVSRSGARTRSPKSAVCSNVSCIRLPAPHDAAPGEPGPKAAQDQEATGFDPALRVSFINADGNGGGGGVAVVLDSVDDLAARDAQHVDSGID